MLNKLLMFVGRLAFALGLTKVIIRRGKQSPKVLLYHDVAPFETMFTKGLDCTLSPDTFAAHLDFLTEHYEVVDIDALCRRRGSKPLVAIAFDDGYRSIYEHAFPALRKRNLPALVYLITDALDNRQLVWVNELNFFLQAHEELALPAARDKLGLGDDAGVAQILDTARLNFRRDTIEALLGELRTRTGRNPAELAQAERPYLSWAEIAEMQAGGISFGNHTRSHPNMARLSDAEQKQEIADAQSALEPRVGQVRHFAYPFGHHNERTAQIALEAGLVSVAEVGGSNRSSAGNFVGRAHITGVSEAELFAQVEVVEPIKAWLRQVFAKPKAGMMRSEPATA